MRFVKKHTRELVALGVILMICLFLNFYKSQEIPGCLNSDEVAFGYNTFALLETGKDEFGKAFPIRFQSFNDYKLPVYTYMSMPFVKIFGLNDFSTRLLNKIMFLALIPSIYVLARKLFKEKKIALVSTFLITLAPWVYIISRHAHEGMTLLFFLVWAIYFSITYGEKEKIQDLILADIMLTFAAHSYHLGRYFVIVILLYQAVMVLKKYVNIRKIKQSYIMFMICAIVTVGATLGVDAIHGAPRVNSLFFIHNDGFRLTQNEKMLEDGNFFVHNTMSESVQEVVNRYAMQISPEFFTVDGDKNPRFGFNGIRLITPVEYALIFVGMYFLFSRKNKHRFLLLFLLILSPLPNALTWQDSSLIRSFFMIIPIVLISGYGVYYLLDTFSGHMKKLFAIVLCGLYLCFVLYSWDFYFFHYFKRALVQRAWQCGYKELVDYVDTTYDRTRKYYITLKHGQPYIYLLFYQKTDPRLFQDSLVLSEPDEYGFTQIQAYDKFQFELPQDKDEPGAVYIGYPDDFEDSVPREKLKKLKFNNEEIFWVLEN